MRVTLHRAPSLHAEDLRAVRGAALGPLLRRSGDVLGIPMGHGLAVRLSDDDELRALTARHAGEDRATDVLAFPGGDGWVGDVAISVPRARAQDPQHPDRELRILAVHGLLHCIGRDHADPESAARMTEDTRRLLPGQPVPDLAAEPPHD